MESIDICPQCGEMMTDKGDLLECPGCNRTIRRELPAMQRPGMSFRKKLALCVILDVLDFTLFRIPGLGSVYDAFLVAISVRLFGGVGFFSIWELLDLTDQIDAEIPTMTILCLLNHGYGKWVSGKKSI
jgi:hypothetical protein